MAQHLQRDLDELTRALLEVGSLVESATTRALVALTRRDKALCREVIDGDREIDSRENRIEEDALKILALNQPVAGDLRFIVTALKVNNDLERMGDLAANVCERILTLIEFDPVPVTTEFHAMVDDVQRMVRDSLNSLVNRDAKLAKFVCELDDRVDVANRGMYGAMHAYMRLHPEAIEAAVSMISVSRNLERIADLATNIAEDVIFMVEGEIVRHRL